ncbi:protein kinase [Kitasatospora sp. NPDC057223]|uniref:protein kinase domain-containing protein n=1 Tax=Kitasatospora sp. NPDC057223 TaxID=3346055 RepID=UPI0036361A35
MIGRALNGRYELVEILGVGGMATVWRGLDRVLGRQVAVKVLNGGLADDPRFAERFGREAQHAAMLVHPRIAMVFDSGVDQGSPYIVMELVQGRSLSSLLAEQPGLPVERAVGIGAAVCEALEVAHAAGLVHRDIKPGNIMITYDGGVKVVDFGIARAGSSGSGLTQAATVLGTAAYLSPEQATAAEVDGRSDLYAVGCVMTEMLTGEPPFTADAPVAIAFKHVTEPAPAPSARRPGLPPALDAVVLRLLAKNPADRPYDAATARAELLATVPAAGGDRTTELLATAPPAQGFPAPDFPAPDFQAPHGFAQEQHTTLLPPVPAAAGYPAAGPATTLMPPVPAAAQTGHRPGAARPGRRRRPLLLGALGVAGLAGVATLAVVALDDGPSAASPPHVTGKASASASAGVSPSAARPAPTATASPSPSPTPTRVQGSAAGIAALRQMVAQAQLPKERDRQNALLKSLDDASQALAGHQESDAEQELKNAQKIVRDLAKKHAIDAATTLNWQGRLTVLVNAVHLQAAAADDGDS